MTETSWEFAGTNLSSIGVVTKLDDYLDIPSKRGDNQEIPYHHGSLFTKKYYSENTLMFGIAIKTTNNQALETAIDTLKALTSYKTEQLLKNTRADGSVRQIYASVEGKIQTSRESYNFAKVIIPFKCSTPFFRSDTLIADNTTVINSNPKSMSVDNTGTVEEVEPEIILTGPLSNPTITNSTNGCVLTYTGTIASPRIITIKTVNKEYVATDDLGVNVIGNISHQGDYSLLPIDRGVNILSVADGTHTTGSVKIKFYPPFL